MGAGEADLGSGDLVVDTETFSDEFWHEVLAGTQGQLRTGRRLMRHLPSSPRCKLCAAPFRGVGGQLMRLIGKGPWPRNPQVCRTCLQQLTDHHGGAEIGCSLMFADVRGSTKMAQTMRPSAIHGLMDRFFDTAAGVLIDHDAIVDRFVGDQAIGIFVPALAGPQHAARAVEAARALIEATGGPGSGSWAPIGVGVSTGTAFVGSVGTGSHVDFTAVGDTVNIAARLASAAATGEVLVTVEAAEAANLDPVGIERRELTLKGRSSATSVLILQGAKSA
jgi:adenylate cyclase